MVSIGIGRAACGSLPQAGVPVLLDAAGQKPCGWHGARRWNGKQPVTVDAKRPTGCRQAPPRLTFVNRTFSWGQRRAPRHPVGGSFDESVSGTSMTWLSLVVSSIVFMCLRRKVLPQGSVRGCPSASSLLRAFCAARLALLGMSAWLLPGRENGAPKVFCVRAAEDMLPT